MPTSGGLTINFLPGMPLPPCPPPPPPIDPPLPAVHRMIKKGLEMRLYYSREYICAWYKKHYAISNLGQYVRKTYRCHLNLSNYKHMIYILHLLIQYPHPPVFQ